MSSMTKTTNFQGKTKFIFIDHMQTNVFPNNQTGKIVATENSRFVQLYPAEKAAGMFSNVTPSRVACCRT